MITIHQEKETDFTKNGYGTLDDYIINPEISWEMNGEFMLNFDYPVFAPYSKYLTDENIVRAPVPYMDDQLFRIYRPIPRLGYIQVTAKHIFYDLNDNFVEDTNVVGKNGLGALNQILNATQYPHRFNAFSDIDTVGNARIVRYNPVEALLDDSKDNTFINRWGGEVYRDNFNIHMRKRLGSNRGVRIEHKKDLTGFESEMDFSTVITRIMPKGFDGLLLPEKYVDSPLLDPDRPKIRVVEYSEVKAAVGEYANDEDAIPLEAAYVELRRLASREYSINHVDEPETVIHVDFVTLENTKEYEDFKELQTIHQGDTVRVSVPEQDIEINSRLVAFKSNPLLENHYTSTTLGNHVLEYTTSRTEIDVIRKEIKNTNELITITRQAANGKNSNFWGTVDPNTLELNAQIDDTYFQEDGDYFAIWEYVEVNGERYWRKGPNTDFGKEIANQLKEAIADVELAQQTADEAVDEINTAIQNAGFTSLDDTIQNMKYITMDAEQNAQQAITDASNAYGLAQTSISEAQTAQANSLTALSQVEDVQTGVSNLDIRVDEVEAELELKADNTFMTEDGELITLSNAITFNAHRFSSDMSRIESRVESLAGEINLVILRDAFEDRRVEATTVYPNLSYVDAGHNTMRELITVTGGEKIALSKETTTPITNDTNWRVIFYDSQMGIISRPMTADNEIVLTVPNNATKMWVSWPKGSKPQIIRGSDFLPYRPNFADQMTTNEMVMFRNEYDEYADRTERRLSAIDSTGGRLEVAETLLTQTADGLQTTVGKVDDQGSRLSTVEQTANGLQSEVYNPDGSSKITQLATGVQSLVTNFSELEIGGRNLIKNSDYKNGLPEREMYNTSISVLERFDPYGDISPVMRLVPSSDTHYFRFQRVIPRNYTTYTFSAWMRRTNGTDYGVSVRIGTERDGETVTVGDTWKKVKVTGKATRGTDLYHFVEIDTNNQWVTIDIFEPMFEYGTMASTHQIAPEDTQSQISQLATNINLRVTKGDLLSQINIEADRQLFQSGKILFDAENVVFSGTAWIPNSVIGNLSADKITSGELTTAVANSVFVNASSVAANTTNFIQSAWNGINSRLSITGNTLTYTHTDGSFTRLNANGLFRFDGPSAYSTNYLFDIITVTGLNNASSPRWVQLPDVYKGKQFKALSVFTDGHGVTDSQYYSDLLTIRIVSYVDRPNIDYANARVPVIGYQRARHRTVGSINNYAIQVQILVQY